MTQPVIKLDDTRDPKQDLSYCPDCTRFYWNGLGHRCDTRMSWRSLRFALSLVLIVVLMLAGVWRVHNAHAQEGHAPAPIKAPAALVKARQQCPLDKPLACRAALVHALIAVSWQRHERLHQGSFGVDHAIRLASALFGVPVQQFESVIRCESRGNPRAKNRHSSATGLLQWLDTSWASQGLPGFSRTDPYASVLAAGRAVVRDHGWSQWECKP